MAFMDVIYDRAKINPQRIALPECANEVMMRAAATVAQKGIAFPFVMGDENELRQLCKSRGIDENLFEFIDTAVTTYHNILVDEYIKLPDTILGEKSIARRITDPLYLSLIMEAVGDVDCTFAGLDATTAEVILAAQTIIGLADEVSTASSFGLIEVEGFGGLQGNIIGFGDSAICVSPNSQELADIAISCCDSIKRLTEWTPRCALLSYSTCGSGSGPDVDCVVEALAIAQKKRPDLLIDGEFQLDAAINKKIGMKKVKRESNVAGQANVIIWPNLSVGNIGLKLIQQFAPSRTYGPILQGFKKPVCDCSRGDTEQVVVDNIAMSVVMASAQRADAEVQR